MFCKQDDIEWFNQQHKILLKIRLFFGSDDAVCQAVNRKIEQEKRRGKYMPECLNRSCFNAWITKNRLVPYKYALLLSRLMNISLELLYRFQLSEDKEKKGLHVEKKTVILWSIQRIIVPADFYDPLKQTSSCIIIDSNNVFVSGLATLKAYQKEAKKNTPAIVIDFKRLMDVLEKKGCYKILASFSLINFDFIFSLGQKSAMSLAFYKLLGNRKSDFKSDLLIANIFGFESKELMLVAQELYLKAPCLIPVIERGEISMSMAAQMLKQPGAVEAFERAQSSILASIFDTYPALSEEMNTCI